MCLKRFTVLSLRALCAYLEKPAHSPGQICHVFNAEFRSKLHIKYFTKRHSAVIIQSGIPLQLNECGRCHVASHTTFHFLHCQRLEMTVCLSRQRTHGATPRLTTWHRRASASRMRVTTVASSSRRRTPSRLQGPAPPPGTDSPCSRAPAGN